MAAKADRQYGKSTQLDQSDRLAASDAAHEVGAFRISRAVRQFAARQGDGIDIS
jgi:hypothetical protein